MLDKSGKNVKTENGWVPVIGNENLVDKELNKNKVVAEPKEKVVKEKKEKIPKVKKDHEEISSRKERNEETSKNWLISHIKKLRYDLHHASKNDRHYIQLNIDNDLQELKKDHNYVPSETELKTKYRGEKVEIGDMFFINGEQFKVLNIDEDGEGFMYKTEKGVGQTTINLIDK